MGQIVSSAAKPKRCNANQLSQVPTPAAGEHILVSSDNSMNAAGQGNFDCYIVGNGIKAASELTLKKIIPSISLEQKSVSDVYEYGEVSSTGNSYALFPSGSPTNRARLKKEYIQEIPSGASSVSVNIGQSIFSSNKYKIGWALYDENYKQISGTVKGFYTSPTSFSQNIVSNAKYFMFYVASISNSTVINFDELDFSGVSVRFNNSNVNYVEILFDPPIEILYKNLLKNSDIGVKVPSMYEFEHIEYTPHTVQEVYEYGEVGITGNIYEKWPSGTPNNRGRLKREFIQEVPDGALSADVTIASPIFAEGKYRIGWAFYDNNYTQMQSTVKGFYSGAISFTAEVVTGAKYFMFYIATVSSNTNPIDFSEIDFLGTSVVFDNEPNTNYIDNLLNPSFSAIYKGLLKNSDIGVKVPSINDVYAEGADYFVYSVNHRGYSTLCPENTEPAFIMSKKKGFAYIEADVLFTSDAVPVILHDYTINRTARNDDGTTISETINIGSITYQQALTYDFGIWKGEQFAGTRILSFEDFIALMKRLSLHPFIELKDSVNGTYWTDARIESVANLVKAAGMQDNVTFISFAISALQKMREYFPKARLGLGFEGSYTTENFATLITNANSLKNNENKVIVTLSYAQMTDTLYQQLKAGGVEPFLWTVNTSSVVLAMPAQVSGVLSDNLIAGKVLLDDLLGEV